MPSKFKCGDFNVPGNRYFKYTYRKGKKLGPYASCRKCEVKRMAERRANYPPPSERDNLSVAIYMARELKDKVTEYAVKHDISFSKAACRLLEQALDKNSDNEQEIETTLVIDTSKFDETLDFARWELE